MSDLQFSRVTPKTSHPQKPKLTAKQIEEYMDTHLPYIRGVMWGHKALTDKGPYTGDVRILNAAFVGSLIAGRMILEFLGVGMTKSTDDLVRVTNKQDDSVRLDDLGGDLVDVSKLNQDVERRDLLREYIRMAHKAAGHMTVPDSRPWNRFHVAIQEIDTLLDKQLSPCAAHAKPPSKSNFQLFSKRGLPMRTSLLCVLCWLTVQMVRADDVVPALTVDGVTYSNVTFGTMTPTRVGIIYSGGITSLPLEKLPPDLQKRFGYDPKRAAEYLQAEQARRQQWVQQQKQDQEMVEKLKTAHSYFDIEVVQVLEDGLIIQWLVLARTGDLGSAEPRLQCLVGYPKQKEVTDGSRISFRAYRDGSYKYTSVMGAAKTIPRFVYCGEYTPEPTKPAQSQPYDSNRRLGGGL